MRNFHVRNKFRTRIMIKLAISNEVTIRRQKFPRHNWPATWLQFLTPNRVAFLCGGSNSLVRRKRKSKKLLIKKAWPKICEYFSKVISVMHTILGGNEFIRRFWDPIVDWSFSRSILPRVCVTGSLEFSIYLSKTDSFTIGEIDSSLGIVYCKRALKYSHNYVHVEILCPIVTMTIDVLLLLHHVTLRWWCDIFARNPPCPSHF